MKIAKLSDYYTEEERGKVATHLNNDLTYWIDDPFDRAFDDGVTELEVTSPEFRGIYNFASANGKLFVKEDGAYIMGVKLIRL